MFPTQPARRMIGKVQAQAPGDMYPNVPMMDDSMQTSPELEQQLSEQQLQNPQQGIQPSGVMDMSGDMVQPGAQPRMTRQQLRQQVGQRPTDMAQMPAWRQNRHDLRQQFRQSRQTGGIGRAGFGSAEKIQNATNKMQSPLIEKFRQKFGQRPLPVIGNRRLMPTPTGPGALPVQPMAGIAPPQRV